MSSLQKVLPACEPARSQALALLAKTHHVPRHLVKGIAKHGLVVGGVPQHQQEEPQADAQDAGLLPKAPIQPG
ncbi:hypothetical protein [Variovorax sp. KK3]|uniref:hypothetical protein n=1 Tax=Variovorax sp. KK3 TaxID=1855728 RepID=UPI00097BB1DC|nr:hypothetical protein [Variovorax sp. KK3]